MDVSAESQTYQNNIQTNREITVRRSTCFMRGNLDDPALSHLHSERKLQTDAETLQITPTKTTNWPQTERLGAPNGDSESARRFGKKARSAQVAAADSAQIPLIFSDIDCLVL